MIFETGPAGSSVKKRLLPPGTTQVSGQTGALIVAQMLGGDRQLAGDLAAALALGLGDLHDVTGLAASARSRASFSFSMK